MSEIEKSAWRSGPMLVGYALTLLIVLFWALVLVLEPRTGAECNGKICRLVSLPPNEIGDTVAGLFGSLAFVWIVVTVFLQSQELKAQREELQLNRIESAKMVQAMEHQAKIFEEELNDRVHKRAELEFDSALRVFLNSMDSASQYLCWKYYSDGGSPLGYNKEIIFVHKLQNTVDSNIFDLHKTLESFHQTDGDIEKYTWEHINKHNTGPTLNVPIDLLEKAITIFPELSKAQQIRYKALRIEPLKVYLEYAYSFEQDFYV